MGYEASILADSLSPDGVRLTTFQVTYPYAVHKDIMTHRMFSRNFQSFRAFPPEKVIANIKVDPFIPDVFGKRIPGMGQRNETLEYEEAIDQLRARELWLRQIDTAIDTAEVYLDMEIAKQQVNFLLQDFTWITGIITATEWSNFWALRADVTDPAAMPRPEVMRIAKMMKKLYVTESPWDIGYGEWHMPLVSDFPYFEDNNKEPDWNLWKKVSTGRCARVSYLTHGGVRDLDKDVQLHDNLMKNGHMSPFEHVATPLTQHRGYIPDNHFVGNFRGWKQYRKEIPNEQDFSKMVSNV